MRSRELIDVQCPFYICSGAEKIVCEGILPDTKDSIKYTCPKDKAKQFWDFCCGCFEKCERYAPIASKYEEEEA